MILLNNRPKFDEKMTVEEFRKHYWYKLELQEICRKYKISSNGTKAELEQYIENFLSGNNSIDTRKKAHKIRMSKHIAKKLSINTKLIEDGFKFNNEARNFFANYFNVKKFSFNKEMGLALRNAEKNNDTSMTVADLIEVYINSKSKNGNESCDSTEEKTYQWNNFVRDFNKDESSKKFKNKMKVASILWSKVRDNPGPKIYNHSLLEKYSSELESFIIE